MRRRVRARERVAAAVLVATTAALAATPALARSVSQLVIPFRSAAGVRLGDSTAQVRRVLGRPSRIIDFRGRTSTYEYRADHVQVIFDADRTSDRTIDVGVLGGEYHTIRALHIGSPERTVKLRLRGYHHFNCSQFASCTMWDGRAFSGAPNTTFAFSRGRLAGIVVQD